MKALSRRRWLTPGRRLALTSLLTIAISVMHDALSSPTWDESKFVVERGKNSGLAIGLRY